jgi:hypothetical protein
VTRADGYGRTGEPSYRDITRFHFDTLDTTRYWFEPLARVFGIPVDEITRRADRWVTDAWGRTHEECNRDERRDRHEHEWQLLRNDHGSVPLIESLRTYIEYHAMLIVAGELIDQGAPVLVAPYEDTEDPWWGWLRSHLDANEDYWLADRRAPTPLEPYCYGHVPDASLFERTPDAFDELLGPHGSDSVVVDSWIHTDDDDHYVHLRVASALVSPESAPALLRALQTAPSRQFQLPYAGEGGGYHGHEIDESGFQLLGWLDDIEVRWTTLDEHDPLARRIADGGATPQNDFLRALHLSADATACHLYDETGNQEVDIEIWSDEAGPGERAEISRASEGRRTWVRRDALLRYLNHRGLDLVIEARVWMFGKSHPGATSDEREEHGFEESRIYVFRRDGALKGHHEGASARAADRERVRA